MPTPMRYFDTETEGYAKPRRYLELKAIIKEASTELDELKGLMTAAVMEEPGGKYVIDGEEFSITERKTWRYSDELQEREAYLKTAKKIEESNGTAQVDKVSAVLNIKRARD